LAPILAGRGGTRNVARLAVLPSVTFVTFAFVSTVRIDAASVLTRVLPTVMALVDIEVAIRTIKSFPA